MLQVRIITGSNRFGKILPLRARRVNPRSIPGQAATARGGEGEKGTARGGIQELGNFVRPGVEGLPECKLQLASEASRFRSKLKLALRQSPGSIGSVRCPDPQSHLTAPQETGRAAQLTSRQRFFPVAGRAQESAARVRPARLVSASPGSPAISSVASPLVDDGRPFSLRKQDLRGRLDGDRS